MLDRLPTSILQCIFLYWIAWSDFLEYLLINNSIKKALWPLCLQYYQWGRECKIPMEAQCITTCNPMHLNQYRKQINWRKRKPEDTIQSFPSITLPHLHWLKLEVDMDQPLPNSLHTLYLYGCFSKAIAVAFPSALTSLSFQCDFNQPIHVPFPDSLKHLAFGDCYNQVFLFPLPEHLVALRFGYSFNQPLVGVLPDSLESLIFDPYGKFNQALPLLPQLSKLWMSRTYVQKMVFPTSLIKLSVNDHIKDVPSLPLLEVLQTKKWCTEWCNPTRFPVLHTLILYAEVFDQNNFIATLSILPTTVTKLNIRKATNEINLHANKIVEILPQLCQLKLGNNLYGIDKKGPNIYLCGSKKIIE